MGLLNFVKEAGEKIWDAVSGGSKEDKADKLKKSCIHFLDTAFFIQVKAIRPVR